MIIAQGKRSAALGIRSTFGLVPQRGAATSIHSPRQIHAIALPACPTPLPGPQSLPPTASHTCSRAEHVDRTKHALAKQTFIVLVWLALRSLRLAPLGFK